MNRSVLRILILDEHATTREPLHAEIAPRVEVRAIAGTGDRQAPMREIEAFTPDVVLIDLDSNTNHAFDTAKAIHERRPGTKLVFVAADFSNYALARALATDAVGCLIKTDPLPDLLDALTRISDGERYYAPAVQRRMVLHAGRPSIAPDAQSPITDLTPRQLEVLRLLAEGRSKRQIAESLHISAKTVGSHVEKLMQRLDVHDRVALARMAIREGVIEP
ncbi:MAG: response regulator [Phycisphaera sp.]|nr:response regulator [Phycisphaera sp.]